jgi:hypothetical protein
MDDGAGNDAGTDNDLMTFTIDINSPTGWTFNSDPTIDISSSDWSVDIQTSLSPPSGSTDPNLPDEVFALSATASAVPEPASLTLLTTASLLTLRRRRR